MATQKIGLLPFFAGGAPAGICGTGAAGPVGRKRSLAAGGARRGRGRSRRGVGQGRRGGAASVWRGSGGRRRNGRGRLRRHHRGRVVGEDRRRDGGLRVLVDVDAEGERAEPELLAVLERLLRDLEAVDVGPVGAALVDDPPGAPALLEPGVAARDGAVGHDDLAARVPPDHALVLDDVDRGAGHGHESQARHDAHLAVLRARSGRKLPSILEIRGPGRQRSACVAPRSAWSVSLTPSERHP